ncbi:MAG TPA: hypothetical protein VGG39_15515 [Polyangiaceae bacterium]|jgi:hypothetical protein
MRLWSAKPSSASPWSDGLRYDAARAGRARRGHVESWFLKANDPRARRALWLKWTIWASAEDPRRGHAVAETWAIAFGGTDGHVATKTTVPFERAAFTRDALGASVDGCTLTETAARGRVESGGRVIAYDLGIEAREGPLVHFPARWMYERGFPRQKIVSPIPNARMRGRVEVQGETWDVDGWPGMVGHNWGAGNSESYAWGHCNAWDDGDDVVFEGFSARVRAGGVLLPPSTALCLRHHGTSYLLTGLASLLTNRGSISPRRWRFHGSGPRVSIDGEMWADTDDLVGLFYPNPDGTTCYCLNSKLAHAEVTVRIEGRAPRTLRSERAALEVATRDPNHGVRMYV